MLSTYKHVFRFYARLNPKSGEWLLDKTEQHHMYAVLRLRAGTVVEFCDGAGQVAEVLLKEVSSRSIAWEVISSRGFAPPHPHLSLCVTADISSSVSDILPPLTQLGVNALSWISVRGMKVSLKARLQRVAISAIKQAKAPYFVELSTYASLEQHLAEQDAAVKHVLHPEATTSLVDQCLALQSQEVSSCIVYCGGSAGFDERACEILANEQQVYLSPYVLKVSTALVSAASIYRGVFVN